MVAGRSAHQSASARTGAGHNSVIAINLDAQTRVFILIFLDGFRIRFAPPD